MLAGAVATLQEISGGRMFLGIGVGVGLEDLRIDYPRPVLALREAITGIRGLLSGERVELDGEMFPVDGASFIRPPKVPVPISIGTRSRQVMQLAGELADTALVGARHFTQDLADEWISRYAVVGRPVEIPEQLEAVTDLGFTSASLNLVAVHRSSMAIGLRETIDGFAQVIDSCR